MHHTAAHPTDRQTVAALRTVADALGETCAYAYDGRFWFVVSDVWSLTLSPDDAGRFRLDACYGRTRVASLWCRAEDHRRLADLAVGLRVETDALTAR
jgi:hypothetical protein